MLILDNLSCVRGGRLLFKNLSVTLGDRAFVVVKGSNGSGKSSLLRIIAQLLEPAEGRVLYANEEVKGEHFEEYCEIVHYLGHRLALKSSLTVYENILFWAKARNNQELVAAALAYFELESYRDVPIYKLSAGLKQRVALSRVLVSNGEVWLLDEPFTHLDEAMRMKLLALLESRCAQGGTVVVTSHSKVESEMVRELNLGDWCHV